MTTTTLRREDVVKDDRKITARTFLGDYIPFAGVRYYAMFGEGDLAEGRARIGPVGWRRPSKTPETRPDIVWAA